jgi:hypothetical protein
LIFALLGVFTYLVLWPTFNKILEAKDYLSRQTARLVKLQAKTKDLEGLNEFELIENNTLALQAVPNEKNVINSMRVLGSASAENGLLIESLVVAPGALFATPSATIPGTFDFDIKLAGAMEQVKDFFKTLEITLPLSKTTDLSIGFTGGATVRLKTYFLLLPEQLGKYDDPVPKLTSDEQKTLNTLTSFLYTSPLVITPGGGGKANPFSP